uniref:Uncharacterized protein n=1 Tax=Trichuris muris TaxID=70415 RepID=A0A5S6Q925_TRIMR
MDPTAGGCGNYRTAHLTNPFFKMEPWLTALKEITYLSGEDRSMICDVRKKCLVNPLIPPNVQHMIVLVTCVREKYETGRSMTVEDESGSMNCILKVSPVDGPHDYLGALSAGAVLLLSRPYFCCLSRMKLYMILHKSMIERLYWVEYQSQPTGTGTDILASQFLRTQGASPTVLQCCPKNEEQARLIDENDLRNQLKAKMLEKVEKDLEALERRFSGAEETVQELPSSCTIFFAIQSEPLNQ